CFNKFFGDIIPIKIYFYLFISVTRVDVLKASMEYTNIKKRALWLQDSALEETHGSIEQINRFADVVIYVSNILREHLETQGIDRNLGEVIHNGFDNSIFYPRKKEINKNKIIFAGALVPEKGIHLLLDAFNIVSLTNPDLELWLYGSESLWGYKQLFKKDSITFNNSKVHFVGKVNQDRLAEAFSDSEIAVIPSLASKRLDPFPLISIEAQASGCPVIVTNCGGLPEGVINNETGFILKNEDPKELAGILINFFNEPDLHNQMRINARKHVEINFNWDNIAEKFVETGKKSGKKKIDSWDVNEFNTNSHKSFLFIAQQVPCFDRTGGEFRTYRIMRQLALEGHKVDLIARDTVPDHFIEMPEEERNRYIADYNKYNINVDILQHVILNKEGDQVRFNINDIDKLLTGRKYDVVVITWWNVALEFMPYIRRHLPNAKLVVDSVDVASLRLMRLAALHDLKKLWIEANHVKQREVEAYEKADIILTVTKDDRDVILKEIPTANIQVVPNVHPICPNPKTFDERKDLLFVGYFKHTPNYDAAKYLVNEIFPLIKKEIPDVNLYLVGNAPTKDILNLQSDSIIVTGFVEDLTPFWQNCRLSVAPLRYGAGFKGKVGQSMAEGLPVVTTSIGVEGMDLRDGEEVLVADNPVEFASLVVKAYNNKNLWSRLSENGLKKVNANWSDKIVAKSLVDACNKEVFEFDLKIKNFKVVEESNYYFLISKGYFWLDQKYFASAEEIFTSAIRQYPDYPNAYIGLAFLYYLTDKFEKSSDLLQQCNALKKFSPGYYTLSGLLNNKQHNYEDAFNNFKLSLKTFNDNSYSHFELGNYYFNKKEYAQSIRHYSAALKSGCKDLNMFQKVFLIFLRLGNISEALKTLTAGTLIADSESNLFYTNLFINESGKFNHIEEILSSSSFNIEGETDISIIIPVFNKIELTKKCIAAIERTVNKKINYELIIINNDSSDTTRTFLKEYIKSTSIKIKVVTLNKNLGFSKANNIGSAFSNGNNLIFLNNDTEPLPGWLEKLYEIIKKDPEVAAVGSKLLFPDGSLQHAGVIIIDDRQLPDPLVARHIYWKAPADNPETNKLMTYQALTAACLLVRKDAFDEVNG
ncbi:MAG: glycosyltransferase, partial [Ignavibacteriaceae bacterium]